MAQSSAWRRIYLSGSAASCLLSLACALTGCSGDGTSTPLGLPSPGDLSLPELPSMQAILPSSKPVVGSPMDVYTRVARGALTCWFGEAGPLKAKYVYHAEANPPSRGGNSEIVIFARDESASDPRALRAYRVAIATVDGATKLQVENLKIEEPLASRLNQDVARWASDEAGCGEGPVTAGWSAQEAPPETPAKSKKGKNP